MTIELFGLPAVGKTTCADMLCEKSEYKRPELETKLAVIWYALLFWFRYPVFCVKLLFFTIKHSKHSLYTKCVHGLGVRLARYMVPVSGMRVVDEGLIQNIMNLSDEQVSEKEIKMLFAAMPKIVDKYIHIVVPNNVQEMYAKKRGRVFARTRSKEEDSLLLEISSVHEEVLSKLLAENNFDVQTGSCETIKI
tara:strand:- start:25438 stop:26016 length:579 start_codon:yes stop_codon:yes gene_type:complete